MRACGYGRTARRAGKRGFSQNGPGLRLVLASIGSIMLSACGGGGEEAGSAPVQIPESPQPAAAPAAPAPVAIDSTTLTPDASATTISFDPLVLKARAEPVLLGVGMHFAQATDAAYTAQSTVPLLSSLGVNSFRDDIYWNAFAPSWDLFGSHLPAQLKAALPNTTAKPLMIINNGNPNIPDTRPPLTETARSLYADFAARAVRALGDRPAIYEIWNEWSLRAQLGAKPLVGPGDSSDPRSVSNYLPLVRAAASAIRATNSGARIIAGSTGDDPSWAWTQAFVANGGLNQVDGLAVHIYNHCRLPVNTARTATDMVDRMGKLKKLVDDANGSTVPIYITEFGWPTGSNSCAVSEAQMADNVAQFALYIASQPWIAGGWVYQLQDMGNDPNDVEDNFGLYDNMLKARPAACAYKEALALVAQAEAMEMERPNQNMFVLKIRAASETKIVAWTTSSDHKGSITVGGSVSYGARAVCASSDASTSGRVVAIGPTPTVISIPVRQTVAVQARMN